MSNDEETKPLLVVVLASAIAYVVLAPALLLILPLAYGENLAVEEVLLVSAGISLVVGFTVLATKKLRRRLI